MSRFHCSISKFYSEGKLPRLQCCRRRESSTRISDDSAVSPPANIVPRRVLCTGRRWYVRLLPVSLEFSSWKCHVLAALGVSKGSGQGALLRPPAFGASKTAGTRHQLTWTKRCHSHAEFIVSLRRGAAAGAHVCPGAIPIAGSVRWIFIDFGYALHNAIARLRLY